MIQNYERRERFVSVKRRFSQFSTSSLAYSLPVHGTLSDKIGALWGPEKPIFEFFEIFLLSELLFTCDKLNICVKKNRLEGTLRKFVNRQKR